MKDKPISVTHSEVEIVYREEDNRWVFTLRGRERSTESLSQAREAIDKPEPKKKSSNFTPVEAWYEGNRWSSNDKWHKVTITSIAEVRVRFSENGEAWIKDGKERNKVDADKLYPVNEQNDAIIKQLLALDAESDALDERIKSTHDKLKAFVAPKDE